MPVAPNRSCRRRWQFGICGALVVGQSVLLAYLLHLDTYVGGVVVLAGFALAAGCHGLLARLGDHRSVQLTVIMSAAGGLGLLLGFVADFGALGLYGWLELCRSAAGVWPAPEQWWGKMSLMPWAWIGMAVGSNAGMALDIWRRGVSAGRAIETFGLCNAGMLFGMAVAEQAAARLTLGLEQTAAALVMVVAMLAGMALGMNAMLTAARAFRSLSASPAR